MSKAQRRARNAMSIRTYVSSKEFAAEGGRKKDVKRLKEHWTNREGGPAWAWKKEHSHAT